MLVNSRLHICTWGCWVLLAGIIGGLIDLPESCGESLRAQSLFRIERSKNANIVQYDAQVTTAGRLFAQEPIIAYWIRLAEDGRREELSFFQKRLAYGFKATYNSRTDSAALAMRAIKERPITVKAVQGIFRAVVRINGRPAFLERVYVTTREGGWLPEVVSLELYGSDAESGVGCYEKISP